MAWISQRAIELRTYPARKLVSTHEEDGEEIQAATFSVDGKRLALAFGRLDRQIRKVRVIDVRSGALLLSRDGAVLRLPCRRMAARWLSPIWKIWE